MGKYDQVQIKWKTNDEWNGCTQPAKRKDIKPEEGALHCGQEVKLKWGTRWYDVIVCEDYTPKKRKANSVTANNKETVTDPSQATQNGESQRYQQFLNEQNARVNGWGEERQKRLEQATTQNPSQLPRAAEPPSSPIRHPAQKEVPIAVVPPSPLKRQRELHTTLHTAKKLKEELEQERTTLREEFKRKEEELKRREEQIQANNSEDVRKVLVSMQESLLALSAQVNEQFRSLASSVVDIQKRLTSMEDNMALSSMLSLTESAESLRTEPPPEPPTLNSSLPTLQTLQTSTPLPPRPVEERSTEVLSPDMLMSYGVPHHLIGETIEAIQQCEKRHLLALKLVQILYTKEEMSSSNCGGNHGKNQLDGRRLDLIKRLAFCVYPVEVNEVSKTWNDIKNKINNKCRYIKQAKKHSVTQLSSAADSIIENVNALQ